MYITAFLHRDELFEITKRWLCDQLRLDDARQITEILISDGFVLGETLKSFSREVISSFHGNDFREIPIKKKGELRDAICHHPDHGSERVKELIESYRKTPEFYYTETPFNGAIFIDKYGKLIGIYRIKRPKRIAEKANRRIAEWIFHKVQEKARMLACERAKKLGIPLELLITPEDEMVREFITAEREIASYFRDGKIELNPGDVSIHDVAGMKIIGSMDELREFEEWLSNHPRVSIVQREVIDNGTYRAINLHVNVPCDLVWLVNWFNITKGWNKYCGRGISVEELKDNFPKMIRGGANWIRIELILSTFQDFVESELGTCIHEERILAQRDSKSYWGYIPSNVEFLTEFLFAVGFSPSIKVERIPIKLWGRSLPDTVVCAIRELYQMPDQELD
jgi:hypothetical protein